MSSSSSSSQPLKNKIAIITGATQGIGYAIAERLGLQGATVLVNSRKQKNVDDAVKQLKDKNIDAHGFVGNLTDGKTRDALIDEAAKKFGRIDIIVSNVASNPIFGSMLEVTTERAWDKIFDVNVKGHFFIVKRAAQYMPKGGRIIIITSTAAYTGNENLGAYSVSKTALVGLIKMLSKALADRQITVNGIAPGIIRTRFAETLWNNGEQSKEVEQTIPLGRFGEPEDVSPLAAFFAGPDSSYITGETVVVAGGSSSRL